MRAKDKISIFFILFILLTFFVLASSPTYLNENSVWEQNLQSVHFASLALADVNNDGMLDMALMGRYATFYSLIYTNNGTTLTSNLIWGQNLTNMHYGSLRWGDINNDGHIDLVAMGCISGGGLASTCDTRGIFVYVNNGSALVSNSSWQQSLTPTWNGAIDLGDINNDGLLDLLITGQSDVGRISRIYLNNGTSFNEDNVWEQNLIALWKSSGQFGDLNNDGYLDLILTGDQGVNSGISKVYINNGTTLEENTIWQTNIGGEYHASISLGDYDNDGYLDLTVIGKTSTDHHRIYRNNRTTFNLVEQESGSGGNLIGIYRGDIAWGDYDNNGYLDIISTGYEGHTTLYLNSGTFSSALVDPESHIPNLESGSALILADLNNDSKLDLIITGYEESLADDLIKVYINNITTNNSLPSTPSNFQNYTTGSRVFFGWNNGSDTETNNTGLYYNLKIGTTSRGNDIISGVFGGGSNPHAGYLGNMMQRRNTTLPLSRFQANTQYFWSVQTIDTGLAKSAWSTEQIFTTSTDITFPTIVVHEPENNKYTNFTTVNFTALAVDNQNITNVTLWANFTGIFALNSTNSSAYNNTNYTFTRTLADGHYQWSIHACDAANQCNSSQNQSLTVDTTAPSISLSSPSNATIQTSNSTVTFTWTNTETNPSNCTVYIDNTATATTTSTTYSKSLSNAAYTWHVSCTDLANNQARTAATRALTVSYTAPAETTTTTSGGGGGGGGTTLTKKFDIDFTSTIEQELTVKQDAVKTFTIDGTNQHKITINEITSNSINLTIQSTPTTIILSLGQTKKIDIDQDGQPDITITLNNIINGNAVITITKLPQPTTETPETTSPILKKGEQKPLFDVKISIPDKYKTVFPGEDILAEITLINVGSTGKVDVELTYTLKNQQGQTVENHTDTKAVETTTGLTKIFTTTPDAQPGQYALTVTLKYQQYTAKTTATITITKRIKYLPTTIQKHLKETATTLGILLATTAILLYIKLKKKEEKLEEKEVKDKTNIERKERELEKRLRKLEKKKGQR